MQFHPKVESADDVTTNVGTQTAKEIKRESDLDIAAKQVQQEAFKPLQEETDEVSGAIDPTKEATQSTTELKSKASFLPQNIGQGARQEETLTLLQKSNSAEGSEATVTKEPFSLQSQTKMDIQEGVRQIIKSLFLFLLKLC